MLDPKLLRDNPDVVRKALSDRNDDPKLVDRFLELDGTWRKVNFELEELLARQNKVSEQIAALKKEKKDAGRLLTEMKELSANVKGVEERARIAEADAKAVSLVIPNIPHPSVKVGADASANAEVRRFGQAPKFDFKPRPHWEIGEALGILDLKAAAKTSGSRFSTLFGAGAALERALITFMLETHTAENGYREVLAPYMVKREAMEGTGQLPKFEEELYRCRDDELYLVPTAEVSVTNIHREEVLSEGALPIKYASYSSCFRREAGSYGKDVKGLIRVHQFNKVELVKFVHPATSGDELEKLTVDAESVLKKLGLHYRVVSLCTGDLGFSSAKTYDLEVWFPSEGRFREISSCSNFGDFQARRAGIKFRPKDGGKLGFVHTLNGSGIAIGRAFAAVLENFQQADGSVVIPEVLRKHLGGLETIKK